jgi:hypothetical protein
MRLFKSWADKTESDDSSIVVVSFRSLALPAWSVVSPVFPAAASDSLHSKIFAPFGFYIVTFDHSFYSKNLYNKNNYDILKIYMMIKHVIAK